MVAQALPSTCAKKVKIASMPAVIVNTQVPMSSGDEGGVMGGMISSLFKGLCTFKTGSSKVKIEGQPAGRLLSMTAQNGSNANFPPGMQIAPSQTKVMVFF
jgi:uncharacterized Zn-binding protein involved in type VI secretion